MQSNNVKLKVGNKQRILLWALNCCFALFALSFTLSAAEAATKYWVGGAGDTVGTNANDWSTTNPTVCTDGAGNASAVIDINFL